MCCEPHPHPGMKYRCLCCGAVFDEPEKELAGHFMYNPMAREVCPLCFDDAFEEEEITDEEYEESCRRFIRRRDAQLHGGREAGAVGDGDHFRADGGEVR